MPWQERQGWVTLRIMSIHHMDTFRYWFGDPQRIYCSVRTDPRTQFPHKDGIATYILEYSNGLRAIAIDDTWTGPAREGVQDPEVQDLRAREGRQAVEGAVRFFELSRSRRWPAVG